MQVSVVEDQNPNDSLLSLKARSSSVVYKIPQNNGSGDIRQSPFTASNLLNLADVPVTISADSLTEDIDYKILDKKSAFTSGIYETDVKIQMIKPGESANFIIEPSIPEAPLNFEYKKADKNSAYFSRQALEVDTSGIYSCASVRGTGMVMGYVFIVLFFLLVALFVITNCLFIDNYVKWRLLMTSIGAHLIAFVVLVDNHIGKLTFGFTEIIFKVLIKYILVFNNL
jgi:hypothetical protein